MYAAYTDKVRTTLTINGSVYKYRGDRLKLSSLCNEHLMKESIVMRIINGGREFSNDHLANYLYCTNIPPT